MEYTTRVQTSPKTPGIVRFGIFEVDCRAGELRKSGVKIRLQDQPLQILLMLLERPGEVVSREEIQARLWPAGTFVEFEHSIGTAIKKLRQALGDEAGTPRYVETVPRRGYRFIFPVAVAVTQPAPAPEPQAVTPLAPKPRRRPRPWGMAAVLFFVICASFVWTLVRPKGRLGNRPVDSLIVLPFVNLSPSPANDYFADGLTEELTSDVARVQGLRVVARTTAFQFQSKPQDIRQIGRQINVAAVLEGSVRWQGSRVRIAAQLNSARDGYHLWAHTYEADAADILQIQVQIAQQIANALSRELRYSALPRTETENLKARNLYLEGMHLRNTTDDSPVRKAILDFQQASQLDPGYAAPQAGLADCYAILAWGGSMRPADAYRLAEAAADRALALDDNLSTAHKSKAIVELVFDWDWPKAQREFERAIELNPSDADAHHWYSHYLIVANRVDDSLRESRLAMDLDPLNFLISAHLSWHYLEARQFGAAVKAAKETLELDPHNTNALAQMAEAYEHMEDFPNAIATWQKFDGYGQLGFLPDVGSGKEETLRYWRARLELEKRRSPHDLYHIARYLVRLGESTKALNNLERAFAGHNANMIYMLHEPYFDTLRDEARWKALVSAMHLE